MKNFLKKYWALLAVIAAALFVFNGNTDQFALQLYALSTVAVVLVIAQFAFDDRDNWGLFPYISLPELVTKAKRTPTGSAIVFAAVIYLISTIIQVAAINY